MSNQNNENVGNGDRGGKLLSPQEREACKMISSGQDLHNQRALALLAIDEGATQARAAQRAGLTPGQVKYWLGKFREIRLAIFPDQVLADAGQPMQTEMEEEPPPAAEKPQKKGKSKKTKDTKKKKTKKSKKKKGKKAAKKKDRKAKNNKGKGKGKKKKKGSK